MSEPVQHRGVGFELVVLAIVLCILSWLSALKIAAIDSRLSALEQGQSTEKK